MVLVDTCILLRSLQDDSPDQDTAVHALQTLWQQDISLSVVPQNIAEFWSVYTRPASSRGGFGKTVEQATAEIQWIEQWFEIRTGNPDLYTLWKDLVTLYDVKGAKVHDARLVAAMLAYGLPHILTFNTDDFQRFTEITPVHPANVETLVQA